MGVWEQDCEPPPGCPTYGLEPAFCLLDPTPFTPTDVDGEVVAISVDAGGNVVVENTMVSPPAALVRAVLSVPAPVS